MNESAATDTLKDRAHWESLSDRELARSIEDVRAMVAEHQAHVDDAQGFLDALIAIKEARRG